MLDDVDRKLLALLQQDGRMSLRELAARVGYTSMGVKKRLDRLRAKGLVKVSASLNADALRLRCLLVMLEVESREAMRRILERFENCPRIVHAFTVLGGYNLAVLAVAEDEETLKSEMMERCSLRSQPGVRRSEAYPLAEQHFQPYLQIRQHLATRDKDKAPCGVDCGACERYHAGKCLACPATKHYRGPL